MFKKAKTGTTIKTFFALAKDTGVDIKPINKAVLKPEIKELPKNETSRFYQ